MHGMNNVKVILVYKCRSEKFVLLVTGRAKYAWYNFVFETVVSRSSLRTETVSILRIAPPFPHKIFKFLTLHK